MGLRTKFKVLKFSETENYCEIIVKNLTVRIFQKYLWTNVIKY